MSEDNTQTDQSNQTQERGWLRVVINLLMIIVLGALAFLVWQKVIVGKAQTSEIPFTNQENDQKTEPTLANEVGDVKLAGVIPMPQNISSVSSSVSIFRTTELQTNIPSRARTEVITYTVKKGDTLFEIADKFNLKPESILFGNYDVLEDNPHILSPGMVLNILPVDGAYYRWKDGDSLEAVANYYRVSPEDIIAYSGNQLDLTALNEKNNGIKPDSMLIIPGGTRPIKDWGPPAITRDNPASARFYGPGSCGTVYSGAIGTGSFIWPTGSHWISGYDYTAIHHAIDIGGSTGDAIYAADSGVVVYAGWSNYGYGNLIVIDHGNGYQTAYAHLSTVAVGCGQSVFQGSYIGAMGSTGNSTGSHLHFEIVFNGAKLNPHNFLP